ncbi:GNAT family N-acetyltransferase [uncultured Friedmanniella sp.]|uniref:GNAT family N-acetyltransferase n=1 Tax=uncultured Friedmanniella sp. TaxID=335381 RepID=UPI0035CAA3C5
MTTRVLSGGESAAPSPHPLDSAAWASLTGVHARFALGQGRARRYPADVSPFAAVASFEDDRAWADLRELYTDGEVAGLAGPPGFTRAVPCGWGLEGVVPGVQLVATDALWSARADDAFVLGAADAPEAVDLVVRTEPGPFRPRTYQLGTYLGLRRDGALVAMAGERLHPTGWTEISAVCTDPAYRRQGLATRLVRAVAELARGRGETPFLHTGATNSRAISLYLAMGFELRREVEFAALRAC